MGYHFSLQSDSGATWPPIESKVSFRPFFILFFVLVNLALCYKIAFGGKRDNEQRWGRECITFCYFLFLSKDNFQQKVKKQTLSCQHEQKFIYSELLECFSNILKGINSPFQSKIGKISFVNFPPLQIIKWDSLYVWQMKCEHMSNGEGNCLFVAMLFQQLENKSRGNVNYPVLLSNYVRGILYRLDPINNLDLSEYWQGSG
jgi:hypothetical protein